MTRLIPHTIAEQIIARVVARLHLRAGGFPRAMSGGAGESAASCRACPVNAGPASRGPSNDMVRANVPDAARDHFTGQGQQPLAISETRRPIHPAAGERAVSNSSMPIARSPIHPFCLPDGVSIAHVVDGVQSPIVSPVWGTA